MEEKNNWFKREETKRKPLMKKESKTKYVILIAFIVLALGYVAYEKLDINLNDIDLFKKDKGEVTQQTSNETNLGDTIEMWGNNQLGFFILIFAICLFGASIAAFILPLFKSKEGLGEV